MNRFLHSSHAPSPSVFGKFVDDCERYVPDQQTTSFVLAFAWAMCNFHEDE